MPATKPHPGKSCVQVPSAAPGARLETVIAAAEEVGLMREHQVKKIVRVAREQRIVGGGAAAEIALGPGLARLQVQPLALACRGGRPGRGETGRRLLGEAGLE